MLGDHVARLLWALPLVLLLGVGLLLVLKRLGLYADVRQPEAAVPRVQGPVVLTDATKAFVVEVQGKAFLVIESSACIDVQAIDGPGSRAAVPLSRPGAPWGARLS